MTAIVLIVVIVFLTANLAILYLPFDKTKRAILSAISFGILTVFCGTYNACHNGIPAHIYEKIKYAPNVEAKRSMMASFNISEEKLNNYIKMHEAKKPTPIELGVTLMLSVTLVLTPVLLNAVRDDKDDEAKKVYRILFSLNILASGFLLSLYYGLELPILPWAKKALKKRETSMVLN